MQTITAMAMMMLFLMIYLFNKQKKTLMKTIAKIFYTKDYSMFKTLAGNREVNIAHIKKLEKSMRNSKSLMDNTALKLLKICKCLFTIT